MRFLKKCYAHKQQMLDLLRIKANPLIGWYLQNFFFWFFPHKIYNVVVWDFTEINVTFTLHAFLLFCFPIVETGPKWSKLALDIYQTAISSSYKKWVLSDVFIGNRFPITTLLSKMTKSCHRAIYSNVYQISRIESPMQTFYFKSLLLQSGLKISW